MTELPCAAALMVATIYLHDLVAQPAIRSAIWAGLWLGVAVALRPSLQLLLPLFVGLAALAVRRRPAVRGTSHRQLPAIVLAVTALTVLAPLAWNSTVRVGAGPGIRSATWINVCDGALVGDGRFHPQRECKPPGEQTFADDATYERRWVEHSRERALDAIGDDPLPWLADVPLRLVRSFELGGWGVRVAQDWSEHLDDTALTEAVFHVSQIGFVLVVGLAVAGVRLGRRRRASESASSSRWLGAWGIPIALVVGAMSGTAVSFGQPRFGWPVIACVVIPFAALPFAFSSRSTPTRGGSRATEVQARAASAASAES